jgi:hypothetical protein
MITLLLSAALSSAALSSAPPVDAPHFARPNCGFEQVLPVKQRSPQVPRIQSLGELPKAHQELAVLRFGADGCSKPVIVRRDVQGDGRFPAPRR